MASWISPDFFYDGADQYTDEPLSYDLDTGTYAWVAQPGSSMWTDWLKLYVSNDVTSCTKIRFWTSEEVGAGVNKIDIDVYYEGGSHGIYYASPHHGGYWEATIPNKTVSMLQIRFQGGSTAGKKIYIHEIAFYGNGGPAGGPPIVPGAGSDDGYSWGVASFDNTGNFIHAGKFTATSVQDAFGRFPVTIEAGSTINSAKLRLYITAVDNPTNLKVFAEKAADPTAPTSRANHNARVRTTAGVDWDLTVNPSTWELSPELKTVIQELVDAYDYSAGKAINMFVDDDGSGASQNITFKSREATPSGMYAPQLIITHTPPVTRTLTTSSGAGGSVTTPGEGVFPGYTDGQVVPIIATPDGGKVFVNWTGDTGDIANPNAESTTITMNADYSIVANFAAAPIPGSSGPGASRMEFRTASGMM